MRDNDKRIDEIDERFKKQLEEFIQSLLSADQIESNLKRINREPVTSEHLYNYFLVI